MHYHLSHLPSCPLPFSLPFSVSCTVSSIWKLWRSPFPLLLYCITFFCDLTGCMTTHDSSIFFLWIRREKKGPTLRKSAWWRYLVYVGKTIMYNYSAKIFKCIFQTDLVSHLWQCFRTTVKNKNNKILRIVLQYLENKVRILWQNVTYHVCVFKMWVVKIFWICFFCWRLSSRLTMVTSAWQSKKMCGWMKFKRIDPGGVELQCTPSP